MFALVGTALAVAETPAGVAPLSRGGQGLGGAGWRIDPGADVVRNRRFYFRRLARLGLCAPGSRRR